jgi:hypothetical protein
MRIVLIILIALFVFIPTTQAQESPSIDTLDIDLWPEFDRPSMLVIYKAVLSPEVSLPAEIIFRIPVEADSPTAVAVGPDASSVADVVYETQVMGDWLDISFIATTPTIQFEYYDPGLVKEGSQRSYDYTWPGDYKVNSLVLKVQHPVGATEVAVTPTMGRTIQETDGFVYNIIELGEVDQDASFDLNLSYQKESDTLSIESFQIQPSATISPGTGGLLSMNLWWVWLLVGLGVLLIAGGGYWYWRLGRQEPEAKRRARRRAPREEAASESRGIVIYCHQCGKRAEPGDRFCRACGTRLKTG